MWWWWWRVSNPVRCRNRKSSKPTQMLSANTQTRYNVVFVHHHTQIND
jgi:hypothetical protein